MCAGEAFVQRMPVEEIPRDAVQDEMAQGGHRREGAYGGCLRRRWNDIA